jgi:hypothetical protein
MENKFYGKIYRWKETWRDNCEFDWLNDMKDCDEAIESLRMHIQKNKKFMAAQRTARSRYLKFAEKSGLHIEVHTVSQDCDRKYEFKSINNAEDLILDIKDEQAEREFCPEWPINEQVGKYCGVYPCLECVSRETFRRTGEAWKLTPQLLKTRWTSESDFIQWLLVMHGLNHQEARIEPMPVILCVSQKKEREINIGWDPYDLGY